MIAHFIMALSLETFTFPGGFPQFKLHFAIVHSSFQASSEDNEQSCVEDNTNNYGDAKDFHVEIVLQALIGRITTTVIIVVRAITAIVL